jgi:hypothetical protein
MLPTVSSSRPHTGRSLPTPMLRQELGHSTWTPAVARVVVGLLQAVRVAVIGSRSRAAARRSSGQSAGSPAGSEPATLRHAQPPRGDRDMA